MKSAKANEKRSKSTATKPKPSRDQVRNKRDKNQRAESTGNELMFEAWKKLYETRNERLL
jgi:hypothetical protein